MDNSYFPISFKLHIILALLALLVFGLQFLRFRKSHHLILAIALPCTLLPYLSDNKTLFYAVGVGEAMALVLALLFSQTIDRDKEPAAEAASEAAEDAAQITDEETASDEKEAADAEDAPVSEEEA